MGIANHQRAKQTTAITSSQCFFSHFQAKEVALLGLYLGLFSEV